MHKFGITPAIDKILYQSPQKTIRSHGKFCESGLAGLTIWNQAAGRISEPALQYQLSTSDSVAWRASAIEV